MYLLHDGDTCQWPPKKPYPGNHNGDACHLYPKKQPPCVKHFPVCIPVIFLVAAQIKKYDDHSYSKVS
jgi:hypothetical protein